MDTDEQQDLRALLTLLDGARRYEPLTETDSQRWRVQPGSALAIDDKRTDPYQVSHSAWHALTVAVDHLHCLWSSLIADEAAEHASIMIHTHAQSSLIRGVMENSARAVWLLAPDFRMLRIHRRLALQAKEVRSSTHLQELVGAIPKRSKEQQLDRLAGLAKAAGTPAAGVKAALAAPSYKEIVRSAGEATGLGDDLAEVIWSGCSALAHGDITGTLNILDRETVSTEQAVALARITGSISALHWMARGAVKVLDHGFRLYQHRATNP